VALTTGQAAQLSTAQVGAPEHQQHRSAGNRRPGGDFHHRAVAAEHGPSGGLTTAQVNVLPTAALAALSTGAIAILSTEQAVALTSGAMASLTTSGGGPVQQGAGRD
jgi:hypothetical protein